MKRLFIPLVVLVGFILCSVFFSWSGHELLGNSVSQSVAPVRSGGSDLGARITRIENGLVPPNIIKGRPIPTTSVVDLMAHFGVPGVSVA